jgi:hypothetical protein
VMMRVMIDDDAGFFLGWSVRERGRIWLKLRCWYWYWSRARYWHWWSRSRTLGMVSVSVLVLSIGLGIGIGIEIGIGRYWYWKDGTHVFCAFSHLSYVKLRLRLTRTQTDSIIDR